MSVTCDAPSSASNLAPTMLPALPTDSVARPHLPASRAEMDARGWDRVDVVFVTGDAYVDHPAFAAGILSRVLEAAGFRVAVLSQPNWCRPALASVRPPPAVLRSQRRQHGQHDQSLHRQQESPQLRRLFAGRPDRPAADRATISYCQRAPRHFPGVPVIAGGVEASLRRLAHYDYWSDTVRRAIMLDAKADLVVFGMASIRSSPSPAASPPARPSRTCATCEASPTRLGASESQDFPPERSSCRQRGGDRR